MTVDLPLKLIRLHPERWYRKTIPNLDKLTKSMNGPNGQLQAIGVDKQNYLIWGMCRLEVAKKEGWATIKAIQVDLENPLQAILDENECRHPLTVSERTEIGKAVEAFFAEKARKHETLGKVLSKGQEPIRAEQKGAEAAGMSRPTFEAAKKVAVNGTEALKKAVDDGTVSVSDAAKVSTEPPKVQDEAVKEVKKGRAKTAVGAAGMTKGEVIEKAKPKPSEPKKPKPGQQIFDDKIINELLGKLVRSVDQRGKTYPGKQPCIDALDRFATAWEQWQHKKENR